MKIGFDLDGVIADLDITLFRLIRRVDFPSEETKNKFKQNYFGGLRLRTNWNPEELISKDDEYHIITARHYSTDDIATFEWCKKYCANAKSVNIVGQHGIATTQEYPTTFPYCEVAGKKVAGDGLYTACLSGNAKTTSAAGGIGDDSVP